MTLSGEVDKEEPTKFEFSPAKDYECLLKQANSMVILIRALQETQTFLNIEIDQIYRQLSVQGYEEINSQRDMNDQLTRELEHAEEYILELEAKKCFLPAVTDQELVDDEVYAFGVAEYPEDLIIGKVCQGLFEGWEKPIPIKYLSGTFFGPIKLGGEHAL